MTTTASLDARAVIAKCREKLDHSLAHFGASNPRLFGSVARGDSHSQSDIDVLVDLSPEGGNPLMRLAGLNEEFRRILGRNVDVVSVELLKDSVAQTALADAVAL